MEAGCNQFLFQHLTAVERAGGTYEGRRLGTDVSLHRIGKRRVPGTVLNVSPGAGDESSTDGEDAVHLRQRRDSVREELQRLLTERYIE